MTGIGLVLLSVGIWGHQEAPPDLSLFRAVVQAAASEASFLDRWEAGHPVFVDLPSFVAADASLVGLTETIAETSFTSPLRSASFEEVEDCSKPGRWRCGIVDDGLHLELLGVTAEGRRITARVRSRKYLPAGVSGLCPREILFTFRSPARDRAEWTLIGTRVDAQC